MPGTVSNTLDLEQRINALERLQAQQVDELKATAANIADSLSPTNMLKNVLSDIKTTPGIRSAAIDTAIGIGTGFIGRKLFIGNSKNIFRKVAGTALQFIITNMVRKKIPVIMEPKEQSNGVHEVDK